MPKPKPKVILLLGIRPDLIRASRVIHLISERPEIEFKLAWSGQHYDDALKDVFIRDLDLPRPDIELGAIKDSKSDAETVGRVIASTYAMLEREQPDVLVFLGDTNTVMGCIAAAQRNVPVVHIEGCMRSYDWRMPEEKYRTIIDHTSDCIYTYFDEYKEQGVREGLNPRNIVVITNLIVDVLNAYYYDKLDDYEAYANEAFFAERDIERDGYYLMTCHRRENVEDPVPLGHILDFLSHSDLPIYFAASPRTRKNLARFGLTLPEQVKMVDPVGYKELLALLVNSRGAITDSGTIVEETAVLQVPSLQMRKASERPQVYDCGSSVKYDPDKPEDYPADVVWGKFRALHGKTWDHNIGDGKASQRLVDDLIERVTTNTIRGHLPQDSHIPVERSYREDGLPDPA